MTSGKNASGFFKNGDNSGMLFRKAQKQVEAAQTGEQKAKAQSFSEKTTKSVIRAAAERRALEKGKW